MSWTFHIGCLNFWLESKSVFQFYLSFSNKEKTEPVSNVIFSTLKVALGVCFALKSWKEYLLLFTYLITIGKDVTFLLITKFKTNKYLSYLTVYRIPN